MNTQHTPEPWEAQTDLDGDTYIQTASPMQLAIDRPYLRMVRLCKPLIAKIFPHDGCAAFSGEANARRIVSCVNACAGVDTETLVAIANGEMNGSEIWELAKVKKQRDELLAALKMIAQSTVLFPPDSLREMASEAIAKAGGV